jgi:hypothetical protein
MSVLQLLTLASFNEFTVHGENEEYPVVTGSTLPSVELWGVVERSKEDFIDDRGKFL